MRSMRRNRFEAVLHNLHFCDHLNHTEDRAYKIGPILDDLENLFLHHGCLEEHLSIDESMIPYFGKHYVKRFIPGELVRFGFRILALCLKY